MDLEKLFFDHGEIAFLYNSNQYMVSCFIVKKLFEKNRVEYCFFPPEDSIQEIQKFSTLNELLDVEIDGCKLRDIWDNVVINVTY